MPNFSFEIARRICSQLGLAILILGFASSTAYAGISSGLRDLLQGAMGADLRVDSFALNKGQATIGETLRATVGVSNGGKAAASSTVLTLWGRFGSSTSTSNAFRLATVRLGTLQPQARITSVSTFPVPNFGRLGAYQIFATVESAAPEQNRQNNTQAKALMVIGPAFSDTDSEPASDPDANSAPPPAPAPIAGGGSSSPPASNPGSGSSSPPASDSGSGPSSPPASDPGSGSSSPPPPPAPSASCDYYASPNGRGTGTTPESPFTIRNFWAVAAPGRTLCLLDGHYTGADSMIDPPDGLKGAAGHHITIRAVNDGKVLIDGQFLRMTISLQFGNNYFTIKGVNAKSSSGSVLNVHRAAHIVFKRVVAWDTPITCGCAVVGIHFTADPLADGGTVLLEDVAAFGTGRKMFDVAQRGDNVTCRRCWARWEGSIHSSPKKVYEPLYNSFRFTCENCIGAWSGESMPETYNLSSGDGSLQTDFKITNVGGYGMITVSSNYDNNCGGLKIYGSLFYVRQNDNIGTAGRLVGANRRNCIDIRHTLVFIHPQHERFNIVRGFELISDGWASPNLSATNLTSIRGSSGDRFGPQWIVQNVSAGASVSAVANPWTTTGAGANLCKKWGTNEPLWPWPMNERINAATASAGSYTGPCPTCSGGRLPRTATNVTTIVESLLGPIAAACKR